MGTLNIGSNIKQKFKLFKDLKILELFKWHTNPDAHIYLCTKTDIGKAISVVDLRTGYIYSDYNGDEKVISLENHYIVPEEFLTKKANHVN